MIAISKAKDASNKRRDACKNVSHFSMCICSSQIHVYDQGMKKDIKDPSPDKGHNAPFLSNVACHMVRYSGTRL